MESTIRTECPIRFNTGITYQHAKTYSEELAKFINTVSLHRSINRTFAASTDEQLDKLLRGYTFPDVGRNYFPVICMVASAGGSGKDTFIDMVQHHIRAYRYFASSVSTVDAVKRSVKLLMDEGFDKFSGLRTFGLPGMNHTPSQIINEKGDAYRQFLHDVKDAWTHFDNGPVKYCLGEVLSNVKLNIEIAGDSTKNSCGIVFVNNRDIDTYETMKDWCYQLGLLCIGIKVDGDVQASDYRNNCDSNVDNIPYDIYIDNHGSINALDSKAAVFAELFTYGISRYGQWVDENKRLRDYFTPDKK